MTAIMMGVTGSAAVAAVEAAKEIFDFANTKDKNKSRISKLRRMA